MSGTAELLQKRDVLGTGTLTSRLGFRDRSLIAVIVDPAKVTRTALQNAASIGALILTTEAIVSDKPEKAAPAAPAGAPDMGGMDF